MDYQKHYDRLIARAKTRELSGYSERHHVVPKCIGGTDAKDNIVRLTPEEHYVAHQLLVQIYPGNKGLIWSAMSMTNGNRKQGGRQNKVYGWLRRRFAEATRKVWTGRKHSPEACAKMSSTRKGLKRGPHTAETKAKMSAASKGRKKSPEHVAAMAATKTGKKFGPRPEWWRQKISDALQNSDALKASRANRDSPEYRAKQAERMREVWAARKQGTL